MADGKQFEVKLMEVLLATPALTALLADDNNGGKSIYVGDVSPTGVRYPALHYTWDELASQEKLPAGNGTLMFILTQSKESASKYSVYVQVRNQLLAILNRNIGQPLTEINVGTNEGLRVVRILRDNSVFGFKEKVDKHYSHINFDIVKSEDEDFTIDYGTWECP